MVFFFKYSNVLYRHIAKDPVKFFKFSQILENLFENIMAAKGFSPAGRKSFLQKIRDFLKNLLLICTIINECFCMHYIVKYLDKHGNG